MAAPLCESCRAAPAEFVCAEESLQLCAACDNRTHASEATARHSRVALSSLDEADRPKCDICQERPGLSFCLQDRSLMCMQCDLAVHNSTPLAKRHDRFPFAGARVGLCAVQPNAAASGRPARAKAAANPTAAAVAAKATAPAPVIKAAAPPARPVQQKVQQVQPKSMHEAWMTPDFDLGHVPDVFFGEFDDLFSGVQPNVEPVQVGQKRKLVEGVQQDMWTAQGPQQRQHLDFEDMLVPDFYASFA